jgi:GNAT superfamily N-acetyltransferase
MIKIRKMQHRDIPCGTALCRMVNWNQLDADWQRLIDLEPGGGVFIAEEDGVLCGTASAISYGSDMAWIGMILVHPEFRGRGIAAQLMTACISYLKEKQVRSIKLDATDMGRPVYLKLGFKDEEPIIRYVNENPEIACRSSEHITEVLDWSEIANLDKAAFGADRSALLKNLSANGPAVQYSKSGTSDFGFGFARAGFHADFIGPVVATSALAAREIIQELLARLSGKPVMIDILPANKHADELAKSYGFEPSRVLTRMYLGEPRKGKTGFVFGAAGFELG